MSTHRVDVVRIGEPEPHPNADALDLVRVNGYTCVVRRGQFREGDLAVYVEPDYVVPLDRPEFAFLRPANKPDRTTQRIGVRRLRGVYSMGLLIPAPDGATEGDDVMGYYGIERYEPPEDTSTQLRGDTEAPPYKQPLPVYDLENVRRFPDMLDGRTVLITEKIHGANARFVWSSERGRMFAGSRREWKQASVGSAWWRVLKANPWIERFCSQYPDTILWGEVYGWVQDLRYGAKPGEVFFRAFDAYEVATDTFWPAEALNTVLGAEQRVPVLYCGRWQGLAHAEALADAESSIAEHMREGVVIEALDAPIEWHDELRSWRIKLKLPGDRYLSR